MDGSDLSDEDIISKQFYQIAWFFFFLFYFDPFFLCPEKMEKKKPKKKKKGRDHRQVKTKVMMI